MEISSDHLTCKCFSFFFQLFQFIGQGLDYFAWDNLLEWTVYLLAIMNVIDDIVPLPLEFTNTK